MAMPNFQLGLLPERKMDWRTFATSYGLEVLLVLLLINVGLLVPDRLELSRQYHITELIPMPALRSEPYKPPPQIQHPRLLPPAPLTAPKLTVPQEVRAPRTQEPVTAPEPPKVALNNFMPAVLKVPGGARPVQIVHTGEFGSSATPTVNLPVQKVQTGGFGDPNSLPGQGKPGAHLVAANTGSFDLPSGPGQGNGSGGSRGVKGTIASAGFGNGIAQAGNGDGRSNGRGVSTGGFGAQEVAQGGMKPQPQVSSGPPTTPVEITFKPNPTYTQEARDLKLEGEVLLEVMFDADGRLHVSRVVRGLGHGLDEAAIAAANKMRFKPALRNGQPVDSSAIVHVVFQLAY
ncbi:MAG TPA: energy transducer TonB [Terriglobales bacterium]|nr:energy transducer TonB [Terriglobales bacterium]